MLKIAAPTCTISEEFKSVLQYMLVAKAKDLLAKRRTTNEYWIAQWDQDYGVPLAKLMKITQNADAFDDEMTRLKSLPYTLFGTMGNYIVGSTQPIEMVDMRAAETLDRKTGHPTERVTRWDAGVYDVYIPIGIALNGLDTSLRPNPQGVHMIPLRNPWGDYRHPHHTSSHRFLDDNSCKIRYTHPTEYTSKTCWGSYASIVTSCVAGGDYVDMFRTIHSYLTRYDRKSPLHGIAYHPDDWKWLEMKL